MIHRIENKFTKEEVLGLLDPIIREWFENKFSTLTEPQAYAIPYIHRGKNVLVSAPTGSGKTLTGFLSIINELFLLAKSGKLEDKVYCVYVSPLKALANDIHRNLEEPLEEIKELARKKGMDIPRITVAVRSGDTSQSQRQKMLKKPPHIFITTPESLALVLSSMKFREKFRDVKYVIIDETHELSSNKRGVMLSLNLERLERLSGPLIRIGLSATQSPIEEMAKFVAGYNDNGDLRDIYIAEVEAKKALDLRVITPVPDLVHTPFEIANERMYDILVDIINSHRTTLIFTNTRSGTEHVAFKLRERGIKSLEAHHSSLGKTIRFRVEEMLKKGELKCVISSTSLELGIDIGYIDIVVQIGSPKSIAKGLQRIGRSGHAFNRVSKGRMIVFDMDDLIECTVLTKSVYENFIDRVFVPKNSLDVLSQVIVGMSLEDLWDVNEAYSLIKRSYCYHDLPYEKFMEVIDYLSGRSYGEKFYSKIWYDESEGKFGKKKSTRMIYFMNMGTIPEEADFVVIDENNVPIGDLSEKFVERLRQGDIFVLGSRTYEFIRLRGSRVYVRRAEGKRPTVPSWAGEMLPRSYDLSVEVGKFRRKIENMIRNNEDVVTYLMEEYYLDRSGALSIYNYIKEQMVDFVPGDDFVLIEGYIDPSSMYNIIFHFPFGRRVNDALSRVIAHNIANRYLVNTRITVTDDAFMITTNKRIDLKSITNMINSKNFENDLRNAIRNTELFKQRFRHCATRSFMILKKYKGADISVTKQQLKSDRLLEMLSEIPNFPVLEETYNEIFNIVMDVPHALEIIRKIENDEIGIKIKDYSTDPSVFSNGVILSSISDIVLMEDRTALLKEIHMKILRKVMPAEYHYMFEPERVKMYFNSKFRISDMGSMLDFIRDVGAADILSQKGVNVYSHSTLPFEETRRIALELLRQGRIVSAYTDRPLFTLPDLLPYYYTVYGRDYAIDEKIIDAIDGKTTTQAQKALGMKRDEFMDLLRNLERAYLIERKDLVGDEFLWGKRVPERMDKKDAVKFVITKFLNYYGPLTLSEISFYLNIGEGELKDILIEMISDGTISRGYFLPGYEEQYMLRIDLMNLRGEETITPDDVKRYRFHRLTETADSLKSLFSRYIFLSSPYEAYLRTLNFSMEEWERYRKERNIIYGKFLNGRFIFTLRNNGSYFKYKKIENTQEIKLIIQKVRAREGIGTEDLSRVLGITQKESSRFLSILEENMILQRDYVENEEISPGDRYSYIEIDEGNIENFIRSIIEYLGPLSLKDLVNITGLEAGTLEPIVEKMNRLDVMGIVYYGRYEKVEAKGSQILMDGNDPFLIPYWNEIIQDYGTEFNYFLVRDGVVEGAAYLENRGDHVLVVEVRGNIEDILSAIIKNSSYFGRTVVLETKEDLDEEKKGILKSLKFRRSGRYYVYGNTVSRVFSKENLLRYVFYKQGIDVETRRKTPIELDALHLGIRSEVECVIRCWHYISPERLKRSTLLYLTYGIPETPTYASLKNVQIFQAIKGFTPEKKHEIIINMVKGSGFVKRDFILEESPLGKDETQEIIDTLFRKNFIVEGPKDDLVHVMKNYDHETAVKLYIEKLINIFGALNVNRIVNITGGILSKREISSALSILSQEYSLVNVFFDDELFLVPSADIELIRRKGMNYDFILDPRDLLYRYLLPEIRRDVKPGKMVIFQGTEITGSFRARKKRNQIIIYDYEGPEDAKKIIRGIFHVTGSSVSFSDRVEII
ncbi:MAG: ATP-dependent helicase [Thermoplasmata archaeon]